jgi:citrate lyase gamma subunit
MDDSRVALSPVTAPMPEHITTKAVAHTTTRTDRVGVAAPIDTEQIHRMIESALEAHLGARNTAARGRPESGTEQIRALVAAELDVREGGALDRTSRSDVVDFRATLLRLLPDLLGDEAVRQKLFAVLALEAVSKPGALGELTGLRAFLRRELSRVAEDLSGKLQIA